MIKQSVKKPFTVLVAVIMVLVLGVVSVTSMTMDLLPPISLPYLIVITTYPGASAEKVEADVTITMENALGTITGVTNVFSTSAENYSMVQLEFEDGTDMDSAMVKVSGAVQEAAGSLPDMCGTPSIMELSMDMMATMYVAVSREGHDIYQLSDLAEADIIPYIQRQSGVASVSSIGVVEKSVQVELDKAKIEELNTKLLARVDDALAEALKEMESAEKQVADGKAELEKQQAAFGETMSGQIFGALEGKVLEMVEGVEDQLAELLPLVEELRGLTDNAQVNAGLQKMAGTIRELMSTLNSLGGGSGDLLSSAGEIEELIGDLMDEVRYIRSLLQDVEDTTDIQKLAARIYAIISGMSDSDEGLATKIGQTASQVAQLLGDNLKKLYKAVSGLVDEVQDETLKGQLLDIAAVLGELMEEASGTLEDASGALGSLDTKKLKDTLMKLMDVLEQLAAADPDGMLGDAVNDIYTALADVQELLARAPELLEAVETMFAQLTQGQLDAAVGFSTALMQLTSAEAQLTEARAQFDSARETAVKSANLDTLLNLETLSQLIYAHNFAMPAGYIDDAEDNAWLLKVGDEMDSVEMLSQTLLVSMDGIGDVRLCDVAEVTVIDNSEDSYAKVNGEESVVLSIFKSSTVGTNTVSKNCQEAFDELEAEYDGMRIDVLMNQGDYIDIIVESVLSSMVLGAALAILVLALFLKDVKPTLVVAISIPLSVLFALVLMYFTGLTLNMITLSGLSLGIGMLVDNSVVVLENIYRLRGRGVSAPRAAVQGTLQVSGSIIASTLTTVCVFLPMMFSTGTVKELLVPMGLSITYCLVASLIVAETVVPASCSTLLRNAKPKEHPWFDRMLNAYERILNWCLDHRLSTIAVAVALLVVTIWQVFQTGIVILPSMTAEQISVSITTGEDMDRTTSYETVDAVMDRILQLEGVSMVGIIDSGSSGSMMGGTMTGSGTYGSYTGYVMSDESLGSSGVTALCEAIDAVATGLDCTVSASANGMGDLGALMSSGLSVSIYGDDLDEIVAVSEEVKKMVESVDGFENAANGLEDAAASRHLSIDRDAAARAGLTTAQIYMEIAGKLTTSAVATTITAGGDSMEVTITDKTALPTLEELLDLEISGTSMDSSGQPVTAVYRLGDFAVIEEAPAAGSISRENQNMYMTVTADTAEGKNTTLLSRTLQEKLDAYEASGALPGGVSVVVSGESSEVNEMIEQMLLMMVLALIFVYLVMVAQFQSLLSPFIVLFTVPLAFTGGMLGLMAFGEQLSLLSLMGFLVLMGTVVNNGIVFVDYTNQLRMGGMDRRDALVATGKTRMRPILMTTLTTVLAMGQLIFGDDMGSQLGGGMAIVIAGGLTYATLMTLFIIPVMYDIFFRRPPLSVDLGSEDLDDVPDDAAEFLAEKARREASSADG